MAEKRHNIPITVHGKVKNYRPLKKEYAKVSEQLVEGVSERSKNRLKWLKELFTSLKKHQAKSTGIPALDFEIRYVMGEWIK